MTTTPTLLGHGGRRLFVPILVAAVLTATTLFFDAGRAGALVASVQVSPNRAEVGVPVTVTGSGFLVSSSGSITFGSVSAGTFNSDVLGNFSTTVRVPSLPEGAVQLKAATGLSSASTTFTVLAASPVLFGVSTPSAPHNLAETDQFEKDAGKTVSLVMYYEAGRTTSSTPRSPAPSPSGARHR